MFKIRHEFRLITVAAFFGLAMGVGPASQPATTQTTPKIDQLIRQLGSDSADDRDAAQKQLEDVGQSAIPALKKAADSDDDPEIRSRASAALAQMKEVDSNGPSLITLHLKDAPLADVLTAIGQQSHAEFQSYGGMVIPGRQNLTLSIEADHKPFWDVMTDVCTQLNVCPTIDIPGKHAIRLFAAQRNWMVDSPHQVVGPFWINVSGLYRSRSIDLQGAPQIDDQFAVRMSVLPEPKLSVGQLSDFVVKEAMDDAGNSLIPKPQAPAMIKRMMIGAPAAQSNHAFECRLAYPPQNAGKKIAILRGEITANLAEGVQQFMVDDVLGTPKVTNPLTHCKIQATVSKQGPEMYRVIVQCTRDGLADEQWLAMLNHTGDLTLADADGHNLTGFQSSLSSIGTNTDTSFTANCLFTRNTFIGAIGAARQLNKTGEARRLIWNVATSVKPMVIAVTFKDLPMP